MCSQGVCPIELDGYDITSILQRNKVNPDFLDKNNLRGNRSYFTSSTVFDLVGVKKLDEFAALAMANISNSSDMNVEPKDLAMGYLRDELIKLGVLLEA